MLVGVLAGESPARGACPVTSVVIPGGGEGDQSAESPDVKAAVGWVKTWLAPTRAASKSTGRSESEPSVSPDMNPLTRIGVWEIGSAETFRLGRRPASWVKELGASSR
jgi:hypothetical protein